MMNPTDAASLVAPSDAELVQASLGGDHGAFGRIVERYQGLLCSLAYAKSGKFSESEDVAQEAFVIAWTKLPELREPEKLRPWLCGILRHQVGRLHRADAREPVRGAEPMEAAAEVAGGEPTAGELTMNQEEQAILWHALAGLPEIYREPLILYYREHRSIEHVAVALELSEDAVKQRLARGRKLLQEKVLGFVEGALERSTPGRLFTAAVLGALPAVVMPPAKAAGLGAVAAHGSMMAKSTGLAVLLASFSGIISTVLTLRSNLDQARTPRERRAVVIATIAFFGTGMGLLVAVYLLRAGAFQWWEHRLGFALLAQAVVVVFILGWPVGVVGCMAWFRRLRTSERQQHPEYFQNPVDQVGAAAGEYRSAWKFLGVPLVHIRFASPEAGARPVFGWVAGGDRAVGILFAWGGWAVGCISVGAFSVGLLSVGALGVGVVSLSTVGVGLLAMGAVSVGHQAYAWLSALGWQTATSNGFGLAHWVASAPVAFAAHANDPVARQIFANPHADRNQAIVFILVAVLTLVPVTSYAIAIRSRLVAARKLPDPGGG